MSVGVSATRAVASVLTRMDEAWLPFRLGVAAMGLAAFDRATPAGWSYKAMLVHVSAWHELTVWRLRRYRERGETGLPSAAETVEIFDALGLRGTTRDAVTREWSADAFNAAVAEAAADRDAAAVLHELSESYARLRDQVAALTDEQVAAHVEDGRSFVEAVVAGNSHGHYAEHHDELLAAVPKTREELVGLVERGWRRFRGAATGVGLTHLARPTSTGWSYKALLAHAARWLEAVVAELPVRLAGRRSDPPDIDAQNANAAAEGDRSSALEVLERLDSAYRGAMEALRGLPDGEVPFVAVRLVAAETYEHFRHHLPELRAARPRTVAQLIERLDEDWRFFREAVRHLGRAGLAERTAAGWTYKDLVAHAAAWLEEAPRRLREVREGRRDPITTTDDEIDRFNARAVESRRLVGPEAMLDELDTAYRQLVEAVRGLRDEEIAGSSHGSGALSIVAWCSYLHFDEHLAELGVAVP